jgi:hypothetical protein
MPQAALLGTPIVAHLRLNTIESNLDRLRPGWSMRMHMHGERRTSPTAIYESGGRESGRNRRSPAAGQPLDGVPGQPESGHPFTGPDRCRKMPRATLVHAVNEATRAILIGPVLTILGWRSDLIRWESIRDAEVVAMARLRALLNRLPLPIPSPQEISGAGIAG